MNIDRTMRLRAGLDYVATPHPKSLVVLHHTVGGSAASTFQYWMHDPRRVATAYLVERDGTVFEVFPPGMMAWHLGVKGGDELERRSIGIELCSEGGLEVRNGHAYAFGTRDLGPVAQLGGRIEYHDWRGFKCFDSYDPAQVDATIALVLDLCRRFSIPRLMPTPAECRGAGDLRRWYNYRGVLHHALLRPDKPDLHPGFPWERLFATLSESEESPTPEGVL